MGVQVATDNEEEQRTSGLTRLRRSMHLFVSEPRDRLATKANVGLSLWLIGTVRAEPEAVISRVLVQSPDPAE